MKKIFSLEIEYAESIFQKMRGLMFRNNFNKALWFRFRNKSRAMTSIHSFFVFFPFDIIWIDKNVIVDLREKVKPWTLNITPKKPADSFIELPAGTIRKNKLKKGKKI